MYFHSSPPLSSSLHPSFPLTLPLHLLYTPVLYTPPLFSSLAHPCGCAFEGSISNTSKGFLAVAACFSLFVYMHIYALPLYNPCTFILALPYMRSLLFGANILLLSVRWKLFPRGGDHPSLHNTRVRMHKSQCSVPTVYSNGPSICSGSCGSVLAYYACWLFSVFPSACLSCSLCLYLFLSFAFMLSFPISVFVCSC